MDSEENHDNHCRLFALCHVTWQAQEMLFVSPVRVRRSTLKTQRRAEETAKCSENEIRRILAENFITFACQELSLNFFRN